MNHWFSEPRALAGVTDFASPPNGSGLVTRCINPIEIGIIMKIIADENITLVDHYFGHSGEIILKPGRAITNNDLLDADILLVRSVTQVNAALLKNTHIKFIGSPVSGIDHLDTAWLNQQGIPWASASACNADAVVEYVITTIAYLHKLNLVSNKKLSVGIIGAGNIGTRLTEKLSALNAEIILCDPIRAAQESQFISTPLNDFVGLDLITVHTPLTFEGAYPTFHLLGKDFLQRQQPQCFLLNTARGAVIDSLALKEYGQHINWCVDVWENEPAIDQDILKQALIATPHIAGYSTQSKYRGTEMIYQQALSMGIIPPTNLPPFLYPAQVISLAGEKLRWYEVILKIFDLENYSRHVKQQLLATPENFDQLRKEFNHRNEFGYIKIKDVRLSVADKSKLERWGIKFII
jgi:erythronate-4-phosphate dehydrogenase